MRDTDYKIMAKKVRQLRLDLKKRKDACGGTEGLGRIDAAYFDGRIQGLTDVLVYLTPDPLSDE